MRTVIETAQYRTKYALPKGENTLPIFRNPKHDSVVSVKPEVPAKYTKLMGLDCGKRILPYTLLDNYDQERTDGTLPAIVIRNDRIKATFLSSLGFRLISLYDLQEDRELLFDNRSIQVANLSTRDAWFAGGIEWNLGQYGHAFSSMVPMFASIQTDADGNEFLRVYDYERCKGIFWHMDFHLPEDSSLLYLHVVAENLFDKPTSMYYWTNSAVYLSDSTRVFASNDNAVYLDPYANKESRNYGYMKMPTIPLYPDVDASFPKRIPFSDEYFFTCDGDAVPWEAAFDSATGKGYFEASTHPLSYRKMFCWGTGRGGRHWQRMLCPDDNTDYVEIQAGLAPSQTHGMILAAHSRLSWTQAFGSVSASGIGSDKDYYEAKEQVSKAVNNLVSVSMLAEKERIFTESENIAPEQIINKGDGWGYLTSRVNGISLPGAYRFEKDQVTEKEKAWDDFLTSGRLPIGNYNLPIVVGEVWRNRLEASLEMDLSDSERSVICYYLGVLLLEEEKVALAHQMLEDSFNLDKNAYAARALGVLEQRRDAVRLAVSWYERALEGNDDPCSSVLEISRIKAEYLNLLVGNGLFGKALEYWNSKVTKQEEANDAFALVRAVIAAHLDDPDGIRKYVIDRRLCNVREGETPLNYLWKRYSEMALGGDYPLPDELDFNMFFD